MSLLKNDGTRGFTLLEVMAAIAMIAVVLVAVYRLQIQTLTMSESMRFYTTAPLLAKSRADAVGLLPDTIGFSDSGNFGEMFPGYAWRVDLESVESEYLGEWAENLTRIDVTVSLNDETFVYRLRTYRHLPEKE